jgi:hypothetical protein
MKASIVMAVVGVCLACLQAAAQDVEERKARSEAPPLSLRLSDEVIHKAVRETLDEHPGSPRLESGKALSGDPYQKFARGFSEARKPDCLHPDAMKFQPNSFVVGGWNIGFGGLFALPFWGAAIARGKCH